MIIIHIIAGLNLRRPQNQKSKDNYPKKSEGQKITRILFVAVSICLLKTGVAFALGANSTVSSEFPIIIHQETGWQALKKLLKFQAFTCSVAILWWGFNWITSPFISFMGIPVSALKWLTFSPFLIGSHFRFSQAGTPSRGLYYMLYVLITSMRSYYGNEGCFEVFGDGYPGFFCWYPLNAKSVAPIIVPSTTFLDLFREVVFQISFNSFNYRKPTVQFTDSSGILHHILVWYFVPYESESGLIPPV